MRRVSPGDVAGSELIDEEDFFEGEIVADSGDEFEVRAQADDLRPERGIGLDTFGEIAKQMV